MPLFLIGLSNGTSAHSPSIFEPSSIFTSVLSASSPFSALTSVTLPFSKRMLKFSIIVPR